jgi:hypothetical protein
MGNMPPEFREYATSRIPGALRIVFGFLFMLVLGAIFSTLGGLLGAVIFGKKTPPTTIDVPPPA